MPKPKQNSPMKAVDLRPPQSDTEWQACHALRRRALFEPYLPNIIYDPAYVGDDKPGHNPLILVHENRVVGTIRIDIVDAQRVRLRLVAVDAAERGKGYGTELLRRSEAFAANTLGRHEIVLSANMNAYEFYLAHGYRPIPPWDNSVPVDQNTRPIGKLL
jgi:GNAT superfamily N-acetyltransferase